MTQDDLSQASRSELIELALRQHHRVEALEQQLRWFQKQLFGARSERRIVEPNDAQLCLGEGLAPTAAEPVSETTVRSHVRRQRPPREPQDDPGLRFDDSVPVETIVIPNPEVEALPEESRSQISEKASYRLAQRPGAYVVLKIARPVVKRADTGALSCPPAPPSVLEKSYADVSLLAGCWWESSATTCRSTASTSASRPPGSRSRGRRSHAGSRRPPSCSRRSRRRSSGRSARAGCWRWTRRRSGPLARRRGAHRLLLARVRGPRRAGLPVRDVARSRRSLLDRPA